MGLKILKIKSLISMSENADFIPLSPQLGVAGSSYRLQMGQVNNYWAIRLAKGNDVLESKVFKDEENNEMPNANKITGWVLSVIAIPNINTFQIQKTVGFVRQKALEAFEDFKRKKESQGKAESGSVTLEKIPEGAQIKRPQEKGWVKDDTPMSAEDKAAVAEISPGFVQSNTAQPSRVESPVAPPVEEKTTASNLSVSPPSVSAPSTTSSGKRQLQTIPRGEGFEPGPGAVTSSSTPASVSKEKAPVVNPPTAVSSDLEARVAELEKIVKKMAIEIRSLKEELAALKQK
jgi:hypothetical protein